MLCLLLSATTRPRGRDEMYSTFPLIGLRGVDSLGEYSDVLIENPWSVQVDAIALRFFEYHFGSTEQNQAISSSW